MLAILLLTAGCADDDGRDTSLPDKHEPIDTGTPVEKLDTGLSLVHFEGHATLSAEAWAGQEHYVATSMDGLTEHCRVTNTAEGLPATDLCPGCTFGFALTLGTGTLAGEACENLGFTADMFEGKAWVYAFAPTYAAGASGYTYDDVLLFGAQYGDTLVWTPWAYAEVDDGRTEIDYASIFAYTAYYYYL